MVFKQRKEGTLLTRIDRGKAFMTVAQVSPGTVNAFALETNRVVFSRTRARAIQSFWVDEKKISLHASRNIFI